MRSAICTCNMLFLDILFKKYWHHWTSVADAGWAHRRPGRGCFPISVYGDEAKYLPYGDKFIALSLGSPLVQKTGFLPQ